VPSIESGGARIDYTVHGDGSSSSSVMLLAGFRAPATSWRYQIPSLIEAGHRVIAVDLPGHGTAPATPHGTTMQTRAGFVHALIEELDLQGVAIVGGSMGANTIWSYVLCGRDSGALRRRFRQRVLAVSTRRSGCGTRTERSVDRRSARGPRDEHGTTTSVQQGCRRIFRFRVLSP